MALSVAERLRLLAGTPRNTVLLAEALTGAGRAKDALPLLRPLLPGTRDVRRTYLSALASAQVAGSPLREELVAIASKLLSDPALTPVERGEVANALVDAGAYDVALPILATLARARGGEWFFAFLDASKKAKRRDEVMAFLRTELARADLSRAQREERLYALIDVAGGQAALPYLESFADSYGGDWVFGYEDALIKSGQEGRFLDYLIKRSERGGLSIAERRDAAFRLLKSGRKAAAEYIFLSLARDGAPNSEDVSQLLYLWGPRPNAAALDWLESRARTATGSARAGWLAHLVDVGASERVVRLAEASGGSAAMDEATYQAYLEALAATRRFDRLSASLRARIPGEGNTNRLRDMGRIASDNGLVTEALLAYQRLLAQKPDDRAALRAAGLAALSQRRYAEARQHLERYVGSGDSDPDVRYIYAEALSALGQRDQAATEYARALRDIDAVAKPSFQSRLVRANVLQRLGRTGESIAAFEALRVERPYDPELRADLATALLQSKSYDRAKQVLSTP
jgi:thioredoxin-like negative regulator of GroEL